MTGNASRVEVGLLLDPVEERGDVFDGILAFEAVVQGQVGFSVAGQPRTLG